MHPLVRDLYKRVLLVGKDYPTGIDHVRDVWKKALRNPRNCPSCVHQEPPSAECQEEILFAVHRGRHMVKEMIGIIQLKKYRTLKKRYDSEERDYLEAMDSLEKKATTEWTTSQ